MSNMSFIPKEEHPAPWQMSQPTSVVNPPVIALVAVIAATCLVVTYYNNFLHYCCCCRKLRPWAWNMRDDGLVVQDSDGMLQALASAHSSGLDYWAMKMLPVFKYDISKDFQIADSDCSVCLTDFQLGETLRILPKCRHAFHIECIDMWLSSHANCPICRCSLLGFDESENPLGVEVLDYMNGSPEESASADAASSEQSEMVKVVVVGKEEEHQEQHLQNGVRADVLNRDEAQVIVNVDQ